MADSQASAPETVTVRHGREKFVVARSATLGELRISIADATDVKPDHQVLLVRGKKVGVDAPDESSCDEMNINPGTTIMLSVAKSTAGKRGGGSASFKPGVEGELQRIEAEIAKVETKITGSEDKVKSLGQGFLNKDQTEEMAKRIRLESKTSEEELMRAILQADDLTATSEMGEIATTRWRVARKSVVQRAQAALRRCDEVQRKLGEMTVDEFDEMKLRRGKDG